MKTHLVSFADGAFRHRSGAFLRAAEAFGQFDSMAIHDITTLPQDFVAQHGDYMRATERGFGYWIWKPVVILECLKAAGPQDCVVYMDGGSTLNPGGRRRFREYLEMACDHPYRMLSFQNIFTEGHWTKADLANHLGLGMTHSHLKTSQLTSNLLVLQNTASNRRLLMDWAAIAIEENHHYSDDSDSVAANHPQFREHRHDQSISSLLKKIRGTEITHLEANAFPNWFERMKPELPVWTTRSRD